MTEKKPLPQKGTLKDKALRVWEARQNADAQPTLIANALEAGYTNARMKTAVEQALRDRKLPAVEQSGYAFVLTRKAMDEIQKTYPHLPDFAAAITVIKEHSTLGAPEAQASAYIVGYTSDGKPAVASILSPSRGACLDDKAPTDAAKLCIKNMQALLEQHGKPVAKLDGLRYAPAAKEAATAPKAGS